MNKSYRSIYNEALGAWVAVSELESAHGKGGAGARAVVTADGGSLNVALSGIAVGVLLAMSVPAWATVNSVDTGGLGSIAISSDKVGPAASATGGSSIAIGVGTTAPQADTVAIGPLASTKSKGDLALGGGAVANGTLSRLLKYSPPKVHGSPAETLNKDLFLL